MTRAAVWARYHLRDVVWRPRFRMRQEQRLQVKRDAKAPPCCSIAFRLCHISDFMKFCARGMSCAVSFMVVEDAATRRQS